MLTKFVSQCMCSVEDVMNVDQHVLLQGEHRIRCSSSVAFLSYTVAHMMRRQFHPTITIYRLTTPHARQTQYTAILDHSTANCTKTHPTYRSRLGRAWFSSSSFSAPLTSHPSRAEHSVRAACLGPAPLFPLQGTGSSCPTLARWPLCPRALPVAAVPLTAPCYLLLPQREYARLRHRRSQLQMGHWMPQHQSWGRMLAALLPGPQRLPRCLSQRVPGDQGPGRVKPLVRRLRSSSSDTSCTQTAMRITRTMCRRIGEIRFDIAIVKSSPQDVPQCSTVSRCIEEICPAALIVFA
jgi:hypothetical protein